MAEKDITTKILEEYDDVFADIINVLLFNGEKRVQENDLEAAISISQYKADNSKLHQLERDTAKYWISVSDGNKIRLAVYGLENQAALDNAMPLRVIGYDGASYRAQLLDDRHDEHCPVITLVLNFSERKWNKYTSLYDCITVPDELKAYVNDYKINVINVQYLEEDTVQKFTSDFGIIAEHFMKTRLQREKGIAYVASSKTIRHVDEFLKMLSVFTNDQSYEEYISVAHQNKIEGRDTTMCEIVNSFRADGEFKTYIKVFSVEFGDSKPTMLKVNEILEKYGINGMLKDRLIDYFLHSSNQSTSEMR